MNLNQNSTTTWAGGYVNLPSHGDVVSAWLEGLITEDEARKFFGLESKVKPCPNCSK